MTENYLHAAYMTEKSCKCSNHIGACEGIPTEYDDLCEDCYRNCLDDQGTPYGYDPDAENDRARELKEGI